MNPEDTAVLDAADELVAAWEASRASGEVILMPRVSNAAEALHQAVRARTPQPQLPEEPPVGAIVACGADGNPLPLYRRWDDDWSQIGQANMVTWPQIVEVARGRAGRDPVRLIAAPSVVDTELARRLVDELEQTHVSDHTLRCPPMLSTDCRSDECVRRNELVDEARARIGGA